MDKPLEAARRSIGLRRFHVAGVEYYGDRPNQNWSAFLLRLFPSGHGFQHSYAFLQGIAYTRFPKGRISLTLVKREVQS